MSPARESFEHRISLALRIGVGMSAAFMLVGILVQYFTHHSSDSRNLRLDEFFLILVHPSGFPLSDLLIYAGIIVLILTPVARVVSAGLAFAGARDWKFALISAVVLAMLITEMIVSLIPR